MKKRVVSLLLCLIMALSLIPTTAFAVGTSSQDDGISLTSIVQPDDQSYYTYEFYLSRDSREPYSTQIVKEGEKLYQPETPTTPEGKVFTGWYDEADNPFTGFGEIGTIAKSQTIKLTAKIEDGYYVYFKDNTGRIIATETGTTGQTIPFEDVSFAVGTDEAITGWYTDSTLTNKVTSVTIENSNITLYAKVEKGYWITFESNGGSYVAPAFYANSKTAAAPDKPTKSGYTFDDWYTDEGLTDVANFASITASTTLYAKWTAANKTNYTVIHWQENVDDDKFSFMESETKTGITGELTKATAKKSYDGFNVRGIEQKTIAGDGSTIVNVYYERNVYTINFWPTNGSTTLICVKKEHTHSWWNGCYNWRGNLTCTKEEHTHDSSCYETRALYTITAKYGAYIGDQWPTHNGSSTWATKKNGNTYQCNIDTMPLGGASFYGPKSDWGSETAYYYVEVLPGESGTYLNGVTYKLHHKDTSPGTGYYVSKEDKYPITGFTYSDGTQNGGNYDNAKFYYTRNSYDIVFLNNGTTEKTVSRKFEQSIADAGYTPTAPTSKEGYQFDGWYDNELCEGNAYDFTGKTMPAQNITLYAKWVAPTYTVTVYDQNDNKLGEIIVSKGDTVTDKLSMLEANLKSTLETGDSFLGWTINRGLPFNPGTKITTNYELYAKVGNSTGYSVTYNANGGTGSMTDNEKYAKGAKATVKSNSFRNGDMVFLGWNTKADGTGTTYYPNSTVEITDNVTLYARWGGKDSTVTLTYNANYGTSPAIKVKTYANNELVQLEAANLFTRPDYEFTGWNTQADGRGTSFAADASARVDNLGSGNVLYAQWVRQTGTLTIKKVVEGVTLDENKTFQFQLYTINDTKLVPYGSPIAVTVEACETSGSTTVSVPTDMYFVQEIADSAAIENYSVTTAYERVDGPIPVLGDVDIDGTAAVVTESGNTTVKVTNTYEAQTADLTIVKKLNTALPQNMTFTFNVKEGTSATTTAEITIKAGDLEGSTTVKDLKIGTRYTVQEDTTSAQVIGYTLTAPGAQKVTINATGAQVEFVNHYAKDTTSVTVTKEWNDNLVKALRPESVTVQLMKNDVPVDGALVVLDDNNQWSHTWTDLPMYNDTGSKITYSVKEVNVPAGYTVAVNPVATAATPTFTITNTANVVEAPEIVPASLTVIKKDADNGALLKGAKFTLIPEGGKATDAAFAETDENGKAVFTDLAKGTYTLKEITAPAGYQATDKTWTITVSDDAKTAAYKLVAGKFVKTITCKVDDVENVVSNGTITITNAKNTGTLTINKTLNVALPKDMTFKFNVMKGTGEPVSATITIEAGKTSGTAIVENLTVGTTYTVQEVAESAQLDGYTVAIPKAQTVKISGVATKDTVSFTNTYTKTVTPAPEKYTFTIDITKNIELLKRTSRNPGKASFTFEAYMVDKQKNVTVLGDVTIETRGTKSASGKLTFTLTDEQLTDGATVYVREVEGNARGWTYDGAIYKLEIGHDGKIVTGDTGLTFTNVYYRKASSNTPTDDKTVKSVKTGDMGIAMYAMTSLLSLGGAALVIKKRKDEK